MVRLMTFLESESSRTLVLALLHTLWQGCVAAGLLYLYLRKCPAQATGKRYAASISALAAIVLAGLVTWSILNYAPAGHAITSTSSHPQASLEAATPTHSVVPMGGSLKAESLGDGASRHSEGNAHISAPIHWQVWAMVVWLAGATLMLGRTGIVLIGENRLRGRCERLLDERIMSLVEQLREQMRIGRRITVFVSERISVPGVVGCIWPALLLPASAVSGVPVEDLRAILTHELAHIKRYDYLVNFCQMVIEALFFFNPAVWWISRQIRIEREACCDAAGVALAGQGVKYAEALVTWAQRLRWSPAAATIGFAGQPGPGSLLDRIKRITVAGHRPQLRISWPTALAMAALSLLCLAGLWKGIDLAVTTTGHVLTPQERIDKIAAIPGGHGNRRYGVEDRIQASGIVRTWDGKPLPRGVFVEARSEQELDSGSRSSTLRTSRERPDSNQVRFEGSVDYGRLFINAQAVGYAPASAGPLTAKPSERIDGIELVLGQGFSAHIRVVDESGQPVAGANINGTRYLVSDANGVATLQHVIAERVSLAVRAAGFQPDHFDGVMPDPNKTVVVTLKRARPTGGIVLSGATGQPIEGAQVHVLASDDVNDPFHSGYVGQTPDVVADASGRFEFMQLHNGHKYLLFARAPGYGCQYQPNVQAGDKDITFKLGARRVIRGRITGDSSLIPAVVTVSNQYEFPGFSGYPTRDQQVPVTVRDGVGYFQVDDPWGRTVSLSAGRAHTSLRPEVDPLDDVVIEMVRPTLRQVVLHFKVPEGAPPLKGNIYVDSAERRESLVVQDGEARCEVPVPSRIRVEIDKSNNADPVGYWFDDLRSISISPGTDPCIVEIPVLPAGAIYGKILGPDGKVAEKAWETVYLKNIEILNREPFNYMGHILTGIPTVMDEEQSGAFKVTSLPLGGDYIVVVCEGNAFSASGVIHLDEKYPIAEVNLQLHQGVKVVGRLFDANDRPIRMPVRLLVEPAGSSLNVHGIEVETDENGRFVFENVSLSPSGVFGIMVWPRADYQPVRQKIKDLRSPVIVHLQRGLRLGGTVIDDATGWPVPNVRLIAFTAPEGREYAYGQIPSRFVAESPTNERGEFVFSNLTPGQYELMPGASLADGRRTVLVTAGQAEPVTLRVTIPPSSRLIPRKP